MTAYKKEVLSIFIEMVHGISWVDESFITYLENVIEDQTRFWEFTDLWNDFN